MVKPTSSRGKFGFQSHWSRETSKLDSWRFAKDSDFRTLSYRTRFFALSRKPLENKGYDLWQ